ncbi:MAG: hypothetical protein P8Z30_03205 [Acidobacteriota bacterium]
MKLRISILAVAMGFWLASSARATTLVRMSLSQLVQASSTIVQGQVVSQESRWNASHTRIMTYTTVQLDKALKGQPPSTLTIEQLGGTVGNFHVRVPGTAFLRRQGQYVLFLEPVKGKAQTYHMVGMMQGAFRIYRERNGVQRRIVLPLGALETGDSSKTLRQSPTLGEFQMTISGALAAPIIIPAGTAMPVVIESTQFRGTGQAIVIARTTSDLFPSKAVVIPAGSHVVGTAQREGSKWKIYWNSVSVRGHQAQVSGSNEISGSLKGQAVVVEAR